MLTSDWLLVLLVDILLDVGLLLVLDGLLKVVRVLPSVELLSLPSLKLL